MDSNTGLQCDICQDNVFALRNTKLLRAYCDISKSARALIFTVKLWAKSKGISDASRGSLSSYAWVLLAIFYLQNVDPPILPVLQDVVLAEAAGGELSGNKPCRFVEDVIVAKEMLRISREGSDFLDEEEFTVAHLLKGFFEFYAYTFDRYTDVVCIRKGNAYRKGKGKCKWKISIEDPFELDHDLGTKIANKAAQKAIWDELRHACTCFEKDAPLMGVQDDKGDHLLFHLTSRLLVKRPECSGRAFARTCHMCGSHDHMSRVRARLAPRRRPTNMLAMRSNGTPLPRMQVGET